MAPVGLGRMFKSELFIACIGDFDTDFGEFACLVYFQREPQLRGIHDNKAVSAKSGIDFDCA